MERNLSIDRSALADTAQADELAALVIAQLSAQLPQLLPLPVDEVAKACGILEIRELQTQGFEGGLIQDEYKEHGYILVKAGSLPERTRFTVAHELGHFVNLRHIAPSGTEQMLCTRDDLRASGVVKNSRHGIEVQANEFAANLLMPSNLLVIQPFMKGSPEISRILALQQMCGVSKAAAAGRYVELHGDDFAILFSKDGNLVYSIKTRDFPWPDVRRGQPIYARSLTREFAGEDGDVSDQEEADSHHWLDDRHARQWQLWEEVLVQENGYRMTLLTGENASDE
jgi:hypothetical protein